MITNATVAYVRTKEQAEELTEAWAKVRAQTAGSEEHVMVALVDPQVELLERQNELLERIGNLLEAIAYPPAKAMVDAPFLINKPEPTTDALEIINKPKRAKKE